MAVLLSGYGYSGSVSQSVPSCEDNPVLGRKGRGEDFDAVCRAEACFYRYHYCSTVIGQPHYPVFLQCLVAVYYAFWEEHDSSRGILGQEIPARAEKKQGAGRFRPAPCCTTLCKSIRFGCLHYFTSITFFGSSAVFWILGILTFRTPFSTCALMLSLSAFSGRTIVCWNCE